VKVLIKVFGVLVALWVVLLVVGFFLPGHYRVERSTTVAARPSQIFPLVVDLKAWSKWGVWFARDPQMKVSYSPVTSEVGSWSQWSSKSQGDGKMTISMIRPGEDFEYKMEFPDMGMVSRGTVGLAPASDASTRVTMTMEGDLGHSPMNRWFGIFMDRLVGPDFEAGLANLKGLSEKAGR
jgi:hypothetical protein